MRRSSRASSQAAGEIAAEDIDRLIESGFPWIRFPRQIEARYEQDRAAERRRHLLIYGAAALAIFDVFLFYDLSLLPDVSTTATLLRLGVVTPFGALVLWRPFYARGTFLREASQTVLSLSAIATIVYLSTVSASDLAVYHHFGAVIVVVYANVVQRLDFPYAVVASVASLAIYVLGISRVEALPDEARLAAIMLMGCGVLLTLFANHRMDRQLRMAYLYRLRDRLRHEELDALSHLDPLTGLGNRRQLDRHLGQLWETPAAGVRSVCVLVLDVDHFKKFNDRYGHPVGDLCLKRLAAIIRGELRNPGDEAFRFGGEEFIVVLADTELAGGVLTAERIRCAVEAARIPHVGSGAKLVVTVSVGAAASAPAGPISMDEIIASADIALYAAKENGRNQVWPPPPGPAASIAHLSEVRLTG